MIDDTYSDACLTTTDYNGVEDEQLEVYYYDAANNVYYTITSSMYLKNQTVLDAILSTVSPL